MTEHITGQQARELLDGSTPGPWTAYGIMRHPETPTYIVGPDGQQIAGSMMGDGVEHRDSDLVRAAPQLAETVAWLYGREYDEGEGPDESKTYYGNGIWYIEADPEQGVSLGYDLYRGMTPDEAVDLARALLAAAEEASDGIDR